MPHYLSSVSRHPGVRAPRAAARFFAPHTAWYATGFSAALLAFMLFEHAFSWAVWVAGSATAGAWCAGMFALGLGGERLRAPVRALPAAALAVLVFAALGLLLRRVFPGAADDATLESGYGAIILALCMTLLPWLQGVFLGRMQRRAKPPADTGAQHAAIESGQRGKPAK